MADSVDLNNVIFSIIIKTGESFVVTKKDDKCTVIVNSVVKKKNINHFAAISYIADFLHDAVYPTLRA